MTKAKTCPTCGRASKKKKGVAQKTPSPPKTSKASRLAAKYLQRYKKL